MKTTANNQRGLGFIGFIFVAVGIIFLAIMGMKLVPPYMHSYQIARILKEVSNDSVMKNASVADIKDSYSKRANINYITDITAADLDISKDGGKLVLTASYTVKIPVAGNATLVLEFSPSSEN
jgi:hypothetical protein